MLRTVLTIAAIVVVLGLVAYAIVPDMGDHVGAWRSETSVSITEGSSDNHLETLIDNAIEGEEGKIGELHGLLANLGATIKRVSRETGGLKAKLGREEVILKKAQPVLKAHKPGDMVKIGSNTYTYKQVEKDVISRVHRCQRLKLHLTDNQRLVVTLNNQLNRGKEKMADCMRKLVEARSKKQELKAKLARLRVAERYVALAKGVDGFDIFGNSKLGKWLDSYTARVEKLEAKIEFHGGQSADGVVEWQESQGALDAVNSYFGTGKPAEVKVRIDAGGRKPSVGDALEQLTGADAK